ncbi:MAG TPA: transcriptional regulator [Arthrobacter sp.]|nr:transcriptional regulator [Arthrobacter sp.]
MKLAQSRADLDDIVHSPVRFAVLAALASVESATYQTLKDALEISYTLLTKHANILEEAGYISVEKSFVGKKAQTTFRLTREGREAFNKHLHALKHLANGLQSHSTKMHED